MLRSSELFEILYTSRFHAAGGFRGFRSRVQFTRAELRRLRKRNSAEIKGTHGQPTTPHGGRYKIFSFILRDLIFYLRVPHVDRNGRMSHEETTSILKSFVFFCPPLWNFFFTCSIFPSLTTI